MFDKNLIDWTQVYIKNRDLIKKEIQEIKKIENGFISLYTNHEIKYLIYPKLDVSVFEEIKEKINNDKIIIKTTVICLNKKENLKQYLRHLLM